MSRLRPGRRSASPPAGGGGDGRDPAWPARPWSVAGALAAAATLIAGPAADARRWSPVAALTSCPTATQPQAVFPSSDPRTSSGPGAILWTGDCAAGAPAAAGVGFAAVAADDVAGPSKPLPQSISPALPLARLAVVGATGDGRLVVTAGVGTTPQGQLATLEGPSGANLGSPVGLRAQPTPVAAATSYVGDVAIASVRAGTGRVVLRIQRHAVPGLSPPALISGRRGRVTGLAVGLDYRGDALVVWAQRGWIYRRVVHPGGRIEAIERVAPSPPAPHLQALISDDNRGIVAWTTDSPVAGAPTTRIYLDASLPGVHFRHPPRLLEQFRDPPGVRLPDGSMRLVRLANEGVLMAWTGITGGHFAIRAASVSLAAPRPASLVSDASADAVLDDLATGPHSEALALWSTAPRSAAGFDPAHVALLGARGVVEAPGLADFSAPEAIAGPGPLATPDAAYDPTTDTAIAVWADVGRGLGYATRGPAADPGQGAGVQARSWHRWPLLAGGLLALICAAGLGLRMRRSRRARRPTGVLTPGRPPRGRTRWTR